MPKIFQIPFFKGTFKDELGTTITKNGSNTFKQLGKGFSFNCDGTSDYIFSEVVSGNYDTIILEVFLNEEGKFKIKNMHRIMPSPIYYMVGEIREIYFYFKDKEINLSSLLGDKLITIRIYKTNLFNHFSGENFR